MPLYTYRAIDAQGKAVLGRADAVNVFDLEQRLARMGLDLVSGAPTSQRGRLIGGGKIKRPELIESAVEGLGNVLVWPEGELHPQLRRHVRARPRHADHAAQ